MAVLAERPGSYGPFDAKTLVSKLEPVAKAAVLQGPTAPMRHIYPCVGPLRTELLTLAHEVDRRGWWQRTKPAFDERVRTLLNLEKKADLVVNYEGMNVPGLTQIPDYTRALMIECEMVPADDVEARMTTRMQSRSVLDGPKPPRLLALIDEWVLRRRIGSPAVMAARLHQLIESAERSNISIRVIPNEGAHAGLNGAFGLPKRDTGHKVVFLENLTSSLFLEVPEEIEAYETAIRHLVRRALSAQESVRRIAELARRWDSGGVA